MGKLNFSSFLRECNYISLEILPKEKKIIVEEDFVVIKDGEIEFSKDVLEYYFGRVGIFNLEEMFRKLNSYKRLKNIEKIDLILIRFKSQILFKTESTDSKLYSDLLRVIKNHMVWN